MVYICDAFHRPPHEDDDRTGGPLETFHVSSPDATRLRDLIPRACVEFYPGPGRADDDIAWKMLGPSVRVDIRPRVR